MAARAGESQAGLDTIYIAVDVGTTMSGYAFVIGKDSTEYCVQPEKERKGKIPTVLMLNEDTTLHSFGEAALAFYKSLDEEELSKYLLYDRFKMSLYKDTMVSGDMEIKATIGNKKLPARIVFSRVLQYFYETAKERLFTLLGINDNDWRRTEVQWIITVPSIWNDHAKELMKEAAIEAGMTKHTEQDNITIALEPEGASLYCRDYILEYWRQLHRPETFRYVVVDCGGGTVDVTVHDLDTKTRRVSEVHQSTGNNWGGTKVDEEIRRLMERVIREDVAKKIPEQDWFWFVRENIQQAKEGVEKSNNSVNIQLTIGLLGAVQSNGGSFEQSSQRVRGVDYRKRHGVLQVKKDILEICFEESLHQISLHVLHLMQTVGGVQCVVLVGGYAESVFLFEHMKEKLPSGCRLIRPPSASLAVLIGAVMYGQNPALVEARISRYTYGIGARVPFNCEKHPLSKKIVCDGFEFCNDVFAMIVEVDEKVTFGHIYTAVYSPLEAQQEEMQFDIYRSKEHEVMYTDDAGCEHLCSLTVPMPNVEKGLDHEVNVEIDFSRTHLHFTATDVETGKTAHVKATFEYKSFTLQKCEEEDEAEYGHGTLV